MGNEENENEHQRSEDERLCRSFVVERKHIEHLIERCARE